MTDERAPVEEELGSEVRGEPSLEDEQNAETGAVGGAIAGTGAAGPLGGFVGATLGGAAGATLGGAAGATLGEDDDHAEEERR
jgi:hypothetical protein